MIVFVICSGYQERGREGQKFVVAPRPARTRAKHMAADPEELKKEREARKQLGQCSSDEGEALNHLCIFDDEIPGS